MPLVDSLAAALQLVGLIGMKDLAGKPLPGDVQRGAERGKL